MPHHPNHMTVPAPTDRRAELVGDHLTQLLDTLDRRRSDENAAEIQLGKVQTVLASAGQRDAEDFAAAIAAGEPDPGPVHMHAAQREFNEAKRLAEGHRRATQAASQAVHSGLADADRDAIVDTLNDRAVDTADQVKKLLAEVASGITEVHMLRNLATFIDKFPDSGGAMVNHDPDTAKHSNKALVDLLDAMSPERPLIHLGSF